MARRATPSAARIRWSGLAMLLTGLLLGAGLMLAVFVAPPSASAYELVEEPSGPADGGRSQAVTTPADTQSDRRSDRRPVRAGRPGSTSTDLERTVADLTELAEPSQDNVLADIPVVKVAARLSGPESSADEASQGRQNPRQTSGVMPTWSQLKLEDQPRPAAQPQPTGPDDNPSGVPGQRMTSDECALFDWACYGEALTQIPRAPSELDGHWTKDDHWYGIRFHEIDVTWRDNSNIEDGFEVFEVNGTDTSFVRFEEPGYGRVIDPPFRVSVQSGDTPIACFEVRAYRYEDRPWGKKIYSEPSEKFCVPLEGEWASLPQQLP